MTDSSNTTIPVKKKTIKKVQKSTSTTVKDDVYKECRNDVYTLLYYANKPFVMTELVLRFKSAGKKILESVLDDLEEKKHITIKALGKTKIYVLNQDRLKYDGTEEVDENNKSQSSLKTKKSKKRSLAQLKEENETIRANLNEIKELNQQLKATTENIMNELSNDQLEEAIRDYKKLIDKNKEYTEVEIVDKDKFTGEQDKLSNLKKEETKRKKIVKNIIDNVSEGMGLKEKQFREEVGINKD